MYLLHMHVPTITACTYCTCTYLLQLHVPIAYAHTCCDCMYLLHMHIPAATACTFCTCTYLPQLHVPIAYAHTCCDCMYLLNMHVPAATACSYCICKGSAAVAFDCWVVALQPGVASVYCSIVQQTSKSVEFFFKYFSMLEGKTYSEARYTPLLVARSSSSQVLLQQ